MRIDVLVDGLRETIECGRAGELWWHWIFVDTFYLFDKFITNVGFSVVVLGVAEFSLAVNIYLFFYCCKVNR